MRNKKKQYEFNLLSKRPLWMRMDLFVVGCVTFAMMFTFGRRMADMEDLMAVGLLILAIAFNGVLLLSNFWSVKAHEFFAYKILKDSQIDLCTNVRTTITNHKQKTTKRFIIPLLTKALETSPGKVFNAN